MEFFLICFSVDKLLINIKFAAFTLSIELQPLSLMVSTLTLPMSLIRWDINTLPPCQIGVKNWSLWCPLGNFRNISRVPLRGRLHRVPLWLGSPLLFTYLVISALMGFGHPAIIGGRVPKNRNILLNTLHSEIHNEHKWKEISSVTYHYARPT